MLADVFLVAIGVLGTCIATYSDLKTREVPDWVSYGMIISGFGIRLIQALATAQWKYVLFGALGFAITLIIGYGMYVLRQWGGGDAKLLMGLGVLFGTRPFFVDGSLPFLAVIFVNVLVCGAIYGILVGAWLAMKKGKEFAKRFKEINREKKWVGAKIAAIGCAGVAFLIIFVMSPGMATASTIYWMLVIILLYPYIIIGTKVVEEVCMMKQVSVANLQEGDWVEQDVMKDGKKVYEKKRLGIEKNDIAKLMRMKVKTVLVKEGIPFVPPFLVGVIISVVSGKIMFLV